MLYSEDIISKNILDLIQWYDEVLLDIFYYHTCIQKKYYCVYDCVFYVWEPKKNLAKTWDVCHNMSYPHT